MVRSNEVMDMKWQRNVFVIFLASLGLVATFVWGVVAFFITVVAILSAVAMSAIHLWCFVQPPVEYVRPPATPWPMRAAKAQNNFSFFSVMGRLRRS